MNNKAAISRAVYLARYANHLRARHSRAGNTLAAGAWTRIRAQHMATARQLKQDAQQ